MEQKLIRIVTGIVVASALLSVVGLFYFPDIHLRAEEAAFLQEQKRTEQEEKMSGLEILDYNTANAKEEGKEETFSQQLRLQIPDKIAVEDVTIEDNYVTQTVTITIPEADEEYLYDYPMIGRSDHIDDLTYESHGDHGVVEIVTDEVFELEKSYDGQYIFLDFLTPQEVYDKVIVIDAGHGGKTPGAIKQGIYEKDIDLAIVLQLKEIFEEQADSGIGVYYTRTDDSNPTFEQRVQLANKSHANLFISIHNNSTKSGRFSSISGTAVMYDEERGEEGLGTKRLAEICLEEVKNTLGSNDKGLVPGNDIYIIRNSEVPVALIEVGFMTNQQELARLNSPEYQKLAAQGIYQAIMRAFEEGY